VIGEGRKEAGGEGRDVEMGMDGMGCPGCYCDIVEHETRGGGRGGGWFSGTGRCKKGVTLSR